MRLTRPNKLKILGFKEPNAVFHVTGVIEKFYGKLWTLRFLKKSGMKSSDLLKVYNTVLRPSAEYCSVVYHNLIPDYISNKLEQVQRQAFKIIYGWDVDYDSMVQNGSAETLKERRITAFNTFATKAAASPRFGPAWFKYANNSRREVRPLTRDKYIETRSRTERGRNNPITAMTRYLNDEHRKSLAAIEQ